ncbi:hypothetical protein [Microbacterium hominis]|nr:hypothetical protein [Microbacterium hominis]
MTFTARRAQLGAVFADVSSMKSGDRWGADHGLSVHPELFHCIVS